MKLLLLIFLAVTFVVISARPSPPVQYNVLALQWPKGVCFNKRTCKPTIPPDFSIHGLWPAVSPCPPGVPPFNSSQVVTLLPKMDSFWPSLYQTQDNNQFWSHEWHAHGGCSLKNVYDYFKFTLDLHENLLSTNSPSAAISKVCLPGNYCPLHRIEGAIKPRAKIVCRAELYRGRTVSVLAQLYLNVTSQKVFVANIQPSRTCSSYVYFP